MVVYWALTPLFVAGYIWACSLVLRVRPTVTAAAVGLLIWLPFPALRALFLNLPGVAWLAFIGLAVPAAMVERLGFRDALVRGRRLGTADYVHALGSLAALVIVVGIAADTLSALLHTQGDNGQRAARLSLRSRAQPAALPRRCASVCRPGRPCSQAVRQGAGCRSTSSCRR